MRVNGRVEVGGGQVVELPALLDHPLIIQTIRRDPSGPDATDGVPNLSRPDPSGADQSDVEHQATDLAVGSARADYADDEGLATCHPKLAMVTCADLADHWDQVIAQFLVGGPAVPSDPRMQAWATAYRGRGRGQVSHEAFSEPYIGALDHRPVGVFLGLNPGRAQLDFQGRSGLFANEIRRHGTYSAWAATWPYLRDPWVATMGTNRYLTSRLGFLRTWTGQPLLTADAMVTFELYPWHSTAVTASMRPDPGIVREFVRQPIRELGAPVFAFGAPWFGLLEDGLGLQVVDRLGVGGRQYPTEVPSRAVLVLCGEDGPVVVAERHLGSAGPPRRSETRVLREAIEPWLGES
jgi:hypothetical protein